MRQALVITAGAVLVAAAVVAAFTFTQANNERLSLSSDLQYRTRVLSDSLESSLAPSFVEGATSTVQRLADRLTGKERITGLWVFDSFGQLAAYSGEANGIPGSSLAVTAMDSDTASGTFTDEDGKSVYVYVQPMHSGTRVVGALMVIQSADYIDAAVRDVWYRNFMRFLAQTFVYGIAIFVLVRFVFYRSIKNLVESVRAARRGGDVEVHETSFGFMAPLEQEFGKISSSLRQARTVASEEARMRLEKIDTPWTAERLREFIKAYLKDRKIFVVSNREPYVHEKKNKKISWHVPAGGMVTALEPLMEACEGTWIAHGSGNADKATADADGKIRVPLEEPSYTLKRVWLTEKEVAGYYNGFSNEALWPLAHMAHVRPLFRKEDWVQYRKVNALFAKTLLKEIQEVERPVVLVQDYHLALVPEMVKKARPDAEVALFWHSPWPSAVQFSICPWRKEILQGMLGADLVGFHTQHYCNNFIDTVATELESRIDYEQFSVHRGEHETRVKAFPISIAFPGAAEPEREPDESVLRDLGIQTEFLGLGVERLDYTKGILERFKGIDFFLSTHPEYRKRFTFLQIVSPSRTSIPKYKEYTDAVFAEAERINAEYGEEGWKPIVIEHRHYSHAELKNLYQLADLCLVTSVHDGMNLVAKEYAAAHGDKGGALILSQFAGASRDMKGALIVNPYSAEDTADKLLAALSMPVAESHRRMKLMRESIRNYNVFRWAAEIIKTLAQIG
jgi:trehalose 6-phosphate synthase